MAEREKRSHHDSTSQSHRGSQAVRGGRSRAEGKEYEIKAKNLNKEDRKFLEEHHGGLSDSTLRAKWVHSSDEHEDRPGQTLATRDHEVIRQWVEERGGKPATVPGTEHGNRPGVLRFNFPGYGGQSLEEINWEDWFKPFDERDLVFVFQEHKSNGQQSNFFILDNPDREDA